MAPFPPIAGKLSSPSAGWDSTSSQVSSIDFVFPTKMRQLVRDETSALPLRSTTSVQVPGPMVFREEEMIFGSVPFPRWILKSMMLEFRIMVLVGRDVQHRHGSRGIIGRDAGATCRSAQTVVRRVSSWTPRCHNATLPQAIAHHLRGEGRRKCSTLLRGMRSYQKLHHGRLCTKSRSC